MGGTGNTIKWGACAQELTVRAGAIPGIPPVHPFRLLRQEETSVPPLPQTASSLLLPPPPPPLPQMASSLLPPHPFLRTQVCGGCSVAGHGRKARTALAVHLTVSAPRPVPPLLQVCGGCSGVGQGRQARTAPAGRRRRGGCRQGPLRVWPQHGGVCAPAGAAGPGQSRRVT